MKQFAFRLCTKKEIHAYHRCKNCQKNALLICFLINSTMFVAEVFYGILHNSASLLSNGAHDVSDAFILGSSIFIISSTIKTKAQVAFAKAFLMFLFGLLPLYQIYKNTVTSITPEHLSMTIIGFFALFGNILSAVFLSIFKNQDINLKSAYICVRNDAAGNLLVIFAGFLVLATGSHWPDTFAGVMISSIVLYSSTKIAIESLRLIKKN